MKTSILKYIFLLAITCCFWVQNGFGQTPTFSSLTGGLTGSISGTNNSRMAVLGFKVQVSGGSITFKKFSFTCSPTTSDAFLANGVLYRSSGTSYSSVSPGTPVGNVSFSGGAITINDLSETISASNNYFLVADAINTSGNYFQVVVDYNSTFATDINNTDYPAHYSDNHGFNYTVSTPYPVTVANQTSGLTPASTILTSGASALKLFEFSVKNSSTGSSTYTSFKINSTVGTVSNYLTNFKLYGSTTNTFPGGSPIATGTASGSYVNFTSLSETLTSGSIKYYWLVADCSVTGSLPVDVQFNFMPAQSNGPITTSTPTTYNNFTVFGNTYNINSAVLAMTSEQNGLAPATIYPGQTDLAVFGFGLSSTAGTATINQININSSNASLSTYYGNARLYSNTTNSYTTGSPTLLGSGTINGGFINFSGLSQVINGTAKYYFLVVDVTYAGSGSNTTSFKFISAQSSAALIQTSPASSFNIFNVNGNSYNITAPSVSYSGNTTGITTSSLVYGQTGIAVIGLNVAATGIANVTALTITNNGTALNLTTAFANAKLYASSNGNFTTGTNTLVGTAVINAANITITGINTVVNNTTKTFYLVIDDIRYASTGYFQAVASSITVSGVTSNPNYYATSYNYGVPPPTIVLTGNNSVANGITQGTLQYGQTGIVLFGFKMDVTGTTNVTLFNIPSTGVNNTFFNSGGTLYRSSSPNFSIGTSTVVNTGALGWQTTYVSVPVNESFSSNSTPTTYYYFLVGDYLNQNASAAGTIKYGFSTSQSPVAVTYSTGNTSPSNVTDGQVFNVGLTFDWAGGSTSFTTATNYRNLNNGLVSGAPGTYDQVRIGVVSYAVGTAQPTVAVGQTISKLIFGTNNTPTLSIASGQTLTATEGIIVNANSTGTITSSGTLSLPSGSISSIASTATLNFTTTAKLINAGTITQAGALTLASTLTNSGTINQSGALTITGALTNTGTINQSGTGVLLASSTLNNTGGTINKTSTGTTTFTSAVTNGAGGTITQAAASGLLKFNTTLDNTGTVNATAAGPITFTGAVTNNSGGEITLSNGAGTFGSTINNKSGAEMTIGDGNVTVGNNFTQAGTLNGGAGDLTITGTFPNSGTYIAGAGNVSITSTFTNTGPYTGGAGDLTVGGVFSNSSTFAAGTGTNDFNGVATFTNSGTLTLSGGITKIVATNFNNAATGVFTATGGSIDFDKAAVQSINNANTTTPVTFYDLILSGGNFIKTLNGAGGANTGKFEVASRGSIEFTSTNTDLAAGTALLTLNSDINGSTNVKKLLTGNSITGTVNVERYFTGGQAYSRGYRLVSSPVSVSSASLILPNLTYIKTKAYVTGTSTSGGFDNTSATANPTFYFYRESMTPAYTSFLSGNYRGVSKINNATASNFFIDIDYPSTAKTLPAGNGFLFFFRGDRATTLNPTAIPAPIAKATTFTALGYLNQGDIAVKHWTTGAAGLLYTAASPESIRGFNLVGNPYASSIDWDTFGTGITGTNISDIIYVYNPTLKAYATYIKGHNGEGTNFNNVGDANIVASGEGFFVVATATSPTLTFTEAAKINAQVPSGSLLMSTPDDRDEPVIAQSNIPQALMATPDAIEVATSTATVTKPVLQYIRLQLTKDKEKNTKDEALIFFKSTAKPQYVKNEDAEYLVGNSLVNFSTRSTDKKNLAINQMPYPTTSITIPLNVKIYVTGIYQIKLSDLKNVPATYSIWLMDKKSKKDSLDIRTNKTYNFNASTTDTNTYASRFTLVIRAPKPVPLKLATFTAAVVTTGAELAWTTQNEGTTTSFTVERSIDNGKTWDIIGGLMSTSKGKYSLIDKFPIIGTDKYRLKLRDVKGVVTYSAIKTLTFSKQVNSSGSNVSVFPNPATTTINVAVVAQQNAKSYAVRITSGNGTLLRTGTMTNTTLWQGSVTTLLPGTYFVQVINNTSKTVVGNGKFVKN